MTGFWFYCRSSVANKESEKNLLKNIFSKLKYFHQKTVKVKSNEHTQTLTKMKTIRTHNQKTFSSFHKINIIFWCLPAKSTSQTYGYGKNGSLYNKNHFFMKQQIEFTHLLRKINVFTLVICYYNQRITK